ncbi:MAG: hypothetical protein Q9175_001834 [Cornicularia normoerica]
MDPKQNDWHKKEDLRSATDDTLPQDVRSIQRFRLLDPERTDPGDCRNMVCCFSSALDMSIRRKALKPFQFANGGPKLQTGQIACVPGNEIMHNDDRYPHPHEFDGLRFVKGSGTIPGGDKTSERGEKMRGTTLTEGTKDFPIRGFGSEIW